MTAEVETERVGVILPDGNIAEGEFRLFEEDPEDEQKVRLSLIFGGEEITASNSDFFSAMQSIRKKLQQKDRFLNCYGGSKNVYPSPMSQDMGLGWKAYRLRLGAPARLADLVSIFDVGPDVVPSSVEEQVAFYKSWLESLR